MGACCESVKPDIQKQFTICKDNEIFIEYVNKPYRKINKKYNFDTIIYDDSETETPTSNMNNNFSEDEKLQINPNININKSNYKSISTYNNNNTPSNFSSIVNEKAVNNNEKLTNKLERKYKKEYISSFYSLYSNSKSNLNVNKTPKVSIMKNDKVVMITNIKRSHFNTNNNHQITRKKNFFKSISAVSDIVKINDDESKQDLTSLKLIDKSFTVSNSTDLTTEKIHFTHFLFKLIKYHFDNKLLFKEASKIFLCNKISSAIKILRLFSLQTNISLKTVTNETSTTNKLEKPIFNNNKIRDLEKNISRQIITNEIKSYWLSLRFYSEVKKSSYSKDKYFISSLIPILRLNIADTPINNDQDINYSYQINVNTENISNISYSKYIAESNLESTNISFENIDRKYNFSRNENFPDKEKNITCNLFEKLSLYSIYRNNNNNLLCLFENLYKATIITELRMLKRKFSVLKLVRSSLNIVKTVNKATVLKLIKIWRFNTSYSSCSIKKVKERVVVEDLEFIGLAKSVVEEVYNEDSSKNINRNLVNHRLYNNSVDFNTINSKQNVFKGHLKVKSYNNVLFTKGFKNFQ